MNLLFWGLTISVIGKVLLVIGLLMAHSEISHEHKIDKKVLKTFKTERVLTLLGIFLIVLGSFGFYLNFNGLNSAPRASNYYIL